MKKHDTSLKYKPIFLRSPVKLKTLKSENLRKPITCYEMIIIKTFIYSKYNAFKTVRFQCTYSSVIKLHSSTAAYLHDYVLGRTLDCN